MLTLATLTGQQPNFSVSDSLPDTAVRLLQCVNILALIQSDDTNQTTMDHLVDVLKKTWMSRPRSGKDRRGLLLGR